MWRSPEALIPGAADAPAEEVIPEVAEVAAVTPAEAVAVIPEEAVAAVIPAAVTASDPFVKSWRTLAREFAFLLHVVWQCNKIYYV